jgi:hypothetical protein
VPARRPCRAGDVGHRPSRCDPGGRDASTARGSRARDLPSPPVPLLRRGGRGLPRLRQRPRGRGSRWAHRSADRPATRRPPRQGDSRRAARGAPARRHRAALRGPAHRRGRASGALWGLPGRATRGELRVGRSPLPRRTGDAVRALVLVRRSRAAAGVGHLAVA